jgi:diguanylate cyclase (GGDEF)-like protein
MKKRCYWLTVASFVLPLLILLAETRGFSKNAFTPATLILPTIVLIFTQILLLKNFLIKPSEDFLTAIQRAIKGDYRARFSCEDINQQFSKLSKTYNQFMSIVEQQTEELIENRSLQSQLYENEKIYRTALELTCDRVFEADLTHNKLLSGQEVYFRTFPFLKTEIYDEIIKSIAKNAIFEDDKQIFLDTLGRAHLLDLFKEGTTEVDLEYRQKLENGETQWMAVTIIHLVNNSSDSERVIGYVKNIDQRKRQELEILKQAQKDGLTSLYNKKATQTLIESQLSNDKAQNTGAVIMIDIDNFKRINDTLGHIQGDSALSQVGEKLSNLFRPVDIVGRIGGDEFLIYMNNYNSFNTLINKLDMICDMFKDIRLGEDGNYVVSGSIGVSLYPQDGTTYTELYQKADQALYVSKSRGKNCYHIYNEQYNNMIGKLRNQHTVIDNIVRIN